MNIQKNQIGFQENKMQTKAQIGNEILICQKTKRFLKGIPINLVQSSKVQIQHLTCFICKNVLWKPMICNQANCYANYCQACLTDQIKTEILSNQKQLFLEKYTKQDKKQSQSFKNCQKCYKKIIKTYFPLINNLLSNLTLRCLYRQQGCAQIISYDNYLKHLLTCSFKKINCPGCKQLYSVNNLQTHVKSCLKIMLGCQKCCYNAFQVQFKQNHTEVKCLQGQLKIKNKNLQKIQGQVEKLKYRLDEYQIIMDKIVKGEPVKLRIDFHTSFPTNFSIGKNEVKLLKSSWNSLKQRYDFLHFYLTSVIKTEGPIGYEWKIMIKDLKGNLLIGICSSLSSNSVDYVINKFGQIKKKSINENKYRLTRKSDFKLNEGDIIVFKYLSFKKTLKIVNQTQNIECLFDKKQIQDLQQKIYTFYSLDTWGDSIRFI